MNAGARHPEELETLFEDAFVLHDGTELCSLFQAGGVLADTGGREARGAEAIARAAGELWRRGGTYVGGTPRVLQARDTALVLGSSGTHVARRRRDGSWWVAISLLHTIHDE